jgi:lantibiotic modifying enzyme
MNINRRYQLSTDFGPPSFAFLKGTDLHAENVIAKGDCPVPVDLETLFQPVLPHLTAIYADQTATANAVRRLKGSVFSTHYLPTWTVTSDLIPIKFGGLNPYYVEMERQAVFHSVNTDEMQ